MYKHQPFDILITHTFIIYIYGLLIYYIHI